MRRAGTHTGDPVIIKVSVTLKAHYRRLTWSVTCAHITCQEIRKAKSLFCSLSLALIDTSDRMKEGWVEPFFMATEYQ